MKIDLGGAMRLIREGKLGEATSALQRRLGITLPKAPSFAPGAPPRHQWHEPAPPRPEPQRPAGTERFLSKTFTSATGSRPYKLFIPSGYSGEPVPLIVMLHGCTQSPDDFAAGTRMNEAAQGAGCLVAYPGQVAKANMQKCWNWFNPDDQRRDSGEAAIVAGIVRQVMDDYEVDPRAVFVAGLSAGAALAAVMGQAYPDLFAAVGVHSGLACGAARDMQSAFVAMKAGAAGGPGKAVPVIVFHGDRDTTVNALNGDAALTQALAGTMTHPVVHQHGRCTWTRYQDGSGRVLAEKYVVHGGGHAWFGGSPAGSYTDPGEPDATKEMLRFFLEHRRPG